MNRTFSSLSVVFLLVFAGSTGCLIDGGMLDDLMTSEFASAIPEPEEVDLRIPADPTPGALRVGETAEYYTVTYQITHRINGTVYMILSVLEDVTSVPPTSQTDTEAVWGPYTPALEPTSFMLVVTLVEEGVYDYVVNLRPRTSTDDEDWQAVLTGRAQPDANEGEFTLDFTTLSTLNPNEDLQGQMTVSYEHAPLSWRSVEMSFINFLDPSENPGGTPTDVTYRYLEDEDTAGEFQFAYLQDVHNDSERPLPEEIQVRSRWQADGQGRADARVSSSEIAADLELHLGLEQDYVQASECWDAGFLRTWYDESPVRLSDDDGELEEGSYDGPGQGDPEECVFDTVLFADDDVAIM